MPVKKRIAEISSTFVLPLAAALLCILCAICLFAAQRKKTEFLQRQQALVARQRAGFESALKCELLGTQAAAEELGRAVLAGASAEAELRRLGASLHGAHLLFLDNENQSLFCSSNAFSQEEYSLLFELLAGGARLCGPAQIPHKEADGVYTRRPVLAFSAPVFAGTRQIGNLGNIVHCEDFCARFVEESGAAQGAGGASSALEAGAGAFLLCNEGGRIIALSPELESRGFAFGGKLGECFAGGNKLCGATPESVAGIFGAEEGAAQGEGSFLFKSGGKKLLLSYSPLRQNGWVLFSLASYKSAQRNILRALAAVFACAAALAALCWAFLRLKAPGAAQRHSEQERFLREICRDLYDNVFEADISQNEVIIDDDKTNLLDFYSLPRGLSYDEALRQISESFIHREFKQQFYETLCAKSLLSLYESGRQTVDIEFMNNIKGALLWENIKARLFYSESTKTVRAFLFLQNIDTEKRRELTLIEKSEKDYLTNLLNKSSFDARVRDFLDQCPPEQKHALIIFDIDNFRQTNELLGYLSGDTIIMNFINTIRTNISDDSIMGRVGGVCFAVLLKDYGSVEDLTALLKTLNEQLRKEVRKDNVMCSITASIGVALFPDHQKNYKRLFASANEALYFSQTHGMDTYTIYAPHLLEHQAMFVDEKDIDELVNTAADGIAKFALNPEFRILYANQKFMNLIGRTAKDMEADDYNAICYFHEDDIPQIFEALYLAMEKKTPYSISYRIQHKEGHNIHVRTKCLFVDETYEGMPVMYSIFTDISDMVKAKEEADSAKEEALAATKAKSSFLASMSHEIRTPMNAIMGMSDLILFDPTSSPSILEYARNISAASRSLLGIINDILDISKIESGKLSLTEVTYEFAPLLKDVITMIKLRAQDKFLDFFVHISPEIPAKLYGDEIRVKQILLNLLSNAVKYTHEGYISLTIEGAQTEGGYELSFIVNDTGIGIRKEDANTLFTEFGRVDTKRNRNIVGTGLGLSITKRLCEMMKGSIECKSEYGIGSTFTAKIVQSAEDGTPFADTSKATEKRIIYFEPRSRVSMHMMLEFEAMKCKTDLCIDTAALANALEAVKGGGKEPYEFIFVSQKHVKNVRQVLKGAGFEGLKTVVLAEDPTFASSDPAVLALTTPVYCVQLAPVLSGNFETLQAHTREHLQNHIFAPGAKVLVVDDNAVNLKVASGLLKTHGISADTTLSGAEAINMLGEKVYDLIFMDHLMPEMDGIETTHKIRALEGNANAQKPVIALTANALTGMREMFIAEGLSDFLSKPIEPASLNAILREWLPPELVHIQDMTEDAEADATAQSAEAAPEVPREINGLDFEAGLEFAGGSVETFHEILGTYVSDPEKRKGDLRELAKQSDLKLFTTNVHGLKSSSRYVGANEVSALAAKLEEAGHNSDQAFIDEHLEECLALYDAAVESIREYLQKIQGEAVEALESGSMDFLAEQAAALKDAAYNLDIIQIEDAMKALAAFRWDDSVKPYIDTLNQATTAFDYDTIYHEAERLEAHIDNEEQQ